MRETEWEEEEEEKYLKGLRRTKEVVKEKDKKKRRGLAKSQSGWGMKRGGGRRLYESRVGNKDNEEQED